MITKFGITDLVEPEKLTLQAVKYPTAYELALKEDKLELACDYLTAAFRLKTAYAYSFSYQRNYNERAAAFREAAKLACMIYDERKANSFLSIAAGLTTSDESHLQGAVKEMLPKSNASLQNILIKRLNERSIVPIRIGNVFLLNNVDCYHAGSGEAFYIELDIAICLSKLDKNYGAYYTFYVIGAKKLIKESDRFMKRYCFMIS